MTERSEIDIYKTPRYKLCDFLIQRRRFPENSDIGTSISFPLQKLRTLFDYMGDGTDEEKIDRIRIDLDKLNRSMVYTLINDKNEEQRVIKIKKPRILISFLRNFRQNKRGKLCSCQRITYFWPDEYTICSKRWRTIYS